MKVKIHCLLAALWMGCFISCKQDRLDILPINNFTADQVFSSEALLTAYMASLYNALPMEDLNTYGNGALSNNTDEAITAFQDQQNNIGDGTWTQYWGYNNIRNVNEFIAKLPAAKANENLIKTLSGEARFIRAFHYFAMVKRYGGVPIITKVQQYDGNNIGELQAARNTEKEVYDFIAADLDEAAAALPETNAKGRVTKNAALALKSRAMLYAASSAKYGSVLLNGLLGIPATEAGKYWKASFDAASAIINSGGHSLYQKNPSKEANFQQLFLDKGKDNPEVIFAKYYLFPDKTHSYDTRYLPFAIRGPSGYSSRMCPTLDLVEQYEYIDGSPGKLKIGTPSNPIFYTRPTDLFLNKDPRLLASVIVPFAEFKGSIIDIQAGIYDRGMKISAGDYGAFYNTTTHKLDNIDGTLPVVGKNGFGGTEKTQTGFLVRKYLDPALPQAQAYSGGSSQPWIEIRYAEVLLNYAEAAIELENVPEAKAKINMIRSRAGIVLLQDADINIARVRKERLVELAFESHRWWDYRRWRVSDKLFNNTWPTALKPYYDVDKQAYRFESTNAGRYARTFNVRVYYERINPAELAKDPKLVQNPNY